MSVQQDPGPQEAKGYAKLDFPDGDYIITTLSLVIGRNMDLADQWKRNRRQERHQQRAREALEQYELEPSQPSQPDDGFPNGHPSSRSGSLEGRPERGLPSNFSEQGGAVHYQDRSDDDQPTRSRKRQRLQYSNSSTTSVTPASVHPSQIDLSGASIPSEGDVDQMASARLPVHPARPEDIKKISQDHLLISYNLQEERWELHVIGNRAFVNESYLEKHSVVPLTHNDEIMIPGVHMTFKLPDNQQHSPHLTPGTFSEIQDSEFISDDGSISDTSPSRRAYRKRGNVSSDSDDSDDEGSDTQERSRKPSGIKLKFKKGGKGGMGGKDSGKKPSHGPAQDSDDETMAMFKSKLGGKGAGDGEQMDDPSSPTTVPPVFEPGSALADVPQDQLPQKRKGPGRPPKNGYVSKKDDKQVKKKMKEYESRGEEPPPYAQLVEEVRKEAKLKELQNRNGQVPSGETEAVLQSIETDLSTQPTGDVLSGATNSVSRASANGPQNNDRVKRTSPKPKQTPKSRSPSPVKPELECTEEELKKPNLTYVPLIDEAIRHSKKGYADLQEIYKIIQKLHPYFAYSTKGLGWQSSVRHNLKSERFKQVGKSGKGGYHAINYDFPLPNTDQKKGRRTTPPPRQAVPVQNGRYMPGQMPPPQYGPPQYQYGQAPANGHPAANGMQMPPNPAYQSPYAHGSGQTALPAQAPNYGPNSAHPEQQGNSSNPSQMTSSTQQPPPPQPSQTDQYGGLVTEIMDWRIRYLQPFVGTDAYTGREQTFKSVLEHLSAIFALPGNEYLSRRDSIPHQLQTDEEKRIFLELVRLFDKYHKPDGDEASSNKDVEPTKNVQNGPSVPGTTSEHVQSAVGAAVAQAKANANATSGVAPATAPVMAQQPTSQPSAVAQPPPTPMEPVRNVSHPNQSQAGVTGQGNPSHQPLSAPPLQPVPALPPESLDSKPVAATTGVPSTDAVPDLPADPAAATGMKRSASGDAEAEQHAKRIKAE